MTTTRRTQCDPTLPLLLVEDDRDIAELVALTAAGRGWQVEWVTTAAEALTAAVERRFGLAMVDLQLADGDATAHVAALRELLGAAPLLVASGTLPEVGLPCDGVLHKPYSLAVLGALFAGEGVADLPLPGERVVSWWRR